MYMHFLQQSIFDYVAGVPKACDVKDRVMDDEVHLMAALTWLDRSIEKCDGHASSKAYRFARGWMSPYPETSGYIILTLLQLSSLYPERDDQNSALRLGDFLVDMQGIEGGFAGREVGVLNTPLIFDTGMILLGLNSLARQGEDRKYEAAARRAGDFLLDSMDDTGCFVRNLSNGIIHTYNVRAAWGLMALAQTTGEQKYADGALQNADWTLRQQRDNGFFKNNIFKPGGKANLHGVSYVMRGLLEISRLTDGTAGKKYNEAVRLTADQLVAAFREHGYIAGELNKDWSYAARYLCLTGYAQLSIILLKLHQETPSADYLETALSLIKLVASTQNITAQTQPYYGGVKGSHPVYGRYAPLQYPNWATKFFIDALLEKRKLSSL
ncbi:MAG: hypothetical protein L3J67_06400 [Hyphomicrobiaceae bacterium]|nr:hypothetical protein [Hyphomicrobiaceae bacterium]